MTYQRLRNMAIALSTKVGESLELRSFAQDVIVELDRIEVLRNSLHTACDGWEQDDDLGAHAQTIGNLRMVAGVRVGRFMVETPPPASDIDALRATLHAACDAWEDAEGDFYEQRHDERTSPDKLRDHGAREAMRAVAGPRVGHLVADPLASAIRKAAAIPHPSFGAPMVAPTAPLDFTLRPEPSHVDVEHVLASTESAPVVVMAELAADPIVHPGAEPIKGTLVRVVLPINCVMLMPKDGESVAHQLHRLDVERTLVRAAQQDIELVAQARIVAMHWMDQEGINGAELDKLARIVNPGWTVMPPIPPPGPSSADEQRWVVFAQPPGPTGIDYGPRPGDMMGAIRARVKARQKVDEHIRAGRIVHVEPGAMAHTEAGIKAMAEPAPPRATVEQEREGIYVATTSHPVRYATEHEHREREEREARARQGAGIYDPHTEASWATTKRIMAADSAEARRAHLIDQLQRAAFFDAYSRFDSREHRAAELYGDYRRQLPLELFAKLEELTRREPTPEPTLCPVCSSPVCARMTGRFNDCGDPCGHDFDDGKCIHCRALLRGQLDRFGTIERSTVTDLAGHIRWETDGEMMRRGATVRDCERLAHYAGMRMSMPPPTLPTEEQLAAIELAKRERERKP